MATPQTPSVISEAIDLLRCPHHVQSVMTISSDGDALRCPVCKHIYRKKDGVWDMVSTGGDRAYTGLLGLLAGDDVSLQFGALHALGRIGRPIPLDLVKPLLDKKILRRAVYDVLGWSKSPEAAELLAEGLLDSARSAKQAAVRALARVSEEPGLEEVVERHVKARLSDQPLEPLVALMDGGNLPTKRAVVRLLSLLGAAEAVQALSGLSDDSISPDVADALARIRGKNTAVTTAPRPAASVARTQPRAVDTISLVSRSFGPMSNEQFQRVRDLVAAESGLFYEPDLKYLVERRVQRRMEATNVGNYEDYFSLLSSGAEKGRDERRKLINVLSTNETYFFREDFQLKAFQEEILPALAKEKAPLGARRLRIWSAGCSSGEEPATIAMLVRESRTFDDWMVEIFGSDINEDTVNAAKLGLYNSSSFRVAPEVYVKKYFQPEGSRLRLVEPIRKMIAFDSTNILESDLAPHLRNLDVIFCRNVIIYFSPEAKRRAVANFFKLLRPGGYLLLGHSESLMSISSQFELVHLKHDLVYRKPRGRS